MVGLCRINVLREILLFLSGLKKAVEVTVTFDVLILTLNVFRPICA